MLTGIDTDRQYSSSSLSSKSPASPGFDHHPPSSHTSTTSSILFSATKPPPINTQVTATTNPLGFDFGLNEPNAQIPSPTSTIYEVIDSPTIPDYVLAEDEPATVDLVRNHLRRPDTSATQAPAPNFHEQEYPYHRRKRSNDYRPSQAENAVETDDRNYEYWDGNSGVFSYYGQQSSEDDSNNEENEKSLSDKGTLDRVNNGYPLSQVSTYSYASASSKNGEQSVNDNSTTSKVSLNVATNVTVLDQSPVVPPMKSSLRRKSSDRLAASSQTYSTRPQGPSPFEHPSNGLKSPAIAYPEEDRNISSVVDEVMRATATARQRQSPISPYSPARSNSGGRNPVITPITTDTRYINAEMKSTSVFPNTPPPSVSPSQNGFSAPAGPPPPEQSLTPPPTVTERKPPSENVIKALKDRIISEPQFISMTATVPTVPIIRMGDDKLEQLRNERRKTTRAKSPSLRKLQRKPMLEDELEDTTTATTRVPRASSPGTFTRRKTSPPGVATRTARRRETTSGSVLFDADSKDTTGSPNQGGDLLGAPEYVTQLPSPHAMEDNPYQHIMVDKPRHRRKLSRQDIDPSVTHSSPAFLRQWEGQPRKMERAIDG